MVIRDEFGKICIEVTAQDVYKAARKYKMSPELCKKIEENRKMLIDAAIEMSRVRKK